MDPNQTQNQTTCINCQAVTTNDGQTVWVCENCGTQNVPAVVNPEPSMPSVTATPPEPVAPAVPAAEPAQPAQSIPQTPVVEPLAQPVQPVQPTV